MGSRQEKSKLRHKSVLESLASNIVASTANGCDSGMLP